MQQVFWYKDNLFSVKNSFSVEERRERQTMNFRYKDKFMRFGVSLN